MGYSMMNIPEWRMRVYFSQSTPRWIFLLIVGVLLAIGGYYLHTSILVPLGGILSSISIIVLLIMAVLKPSDNAYDKWLGDQFRILDSTVLPKLHLQPSQVVGDRLHLHGFVFPGTEDAASYGDVRVKEGRDKYSRFSVNVYTFFVATQDHIAIFVTDVNALDQSTHVENASYYYYDHVVGVTTRDVQVKIKLWGKEYNVLLQNFALQATNGESVKVGASLRAKPIGKSKNVPVLTAVDTEIGKVTAALLLLLRNHRKSP
ncbi:MAG: hypothetical protein NVS4B12_28050 [Ktedonobacteraceae bacterium]